MTEQKNPDMRKQEREQLLDLGSDLSRSSGSSAGGTVYLVF